LGTDFGGKRDPNPMHPRWVVCGLFPISSLDRCINSTSRIDRIHERSSQERLVKDLEIEAVGEVESIPVDVVCGVGAHVQRLGVVRADERGIAKSIRVSRAGAATGVEGFGETCNRVDRSDQSCTI
jgi:hypothetical protein